MIQQQIATHKTGSETLPEMCCENELTFIHVKIHLELLMKEN
ncbi:hypothetical protein Ocin01_06297 [Orchesella cincta]|uniref:Uncharacterized protein n=1 Tax=Orchesella cincta TaxID=48709 RepID=A0A1D2N541_ORCCI|nr:hypothetical protein Ocin01_06297 [Orchesella cincta]